MKRIVFLVAMTAMAVAANAAVEFDLSFDIDGNTGHGALTATANADGTFLVTWASLTVTAGAYASVEPYSLAPNTLNDGSYSSVGPFSHGSQNMNYDNIVYQNAGSFYIDGAGLGLWTANLTLGTGINLWEDGSPTDAQFYAYANGALYHTPTAGTITISLVSVPEPSIYGAAAALILLPLAASTPRILRNRQEA